MFFFFFITPTFAAEKRHGIPDIIWTPTDVIALDVLDVLGENANIPVVDGFDWSKSGTTSIINGDLDLSSGGHFLDGVWALVSVHDYFLNIDLHSDENGIFFSEMSNITLEKTDDKEEWLAQEHWRNIDTSTDNLLLLMINA